MQKDGSSNDDDGGDQQDDGNDDRKQGGEFRVPLAVFERLRVRSRQFDMDVRPTVVVAISIPLSVLFTVLLMYFSGLSLNIMTLSGLSLGIGMLVDNSIVVMENIIRLRQRGVSTARACVQGGSGSSFRPRSGSGGAAL